MASTAQPDPYRVLGVDVNADAGTIRSAYRRLVLKCHPDKVQDPALKAIKQEEFQRVHQAYEILNDDDKRREYDLEVKAKRLREELYKSGASSGTPPKKYYNVNIRTAEPPSFSSSPQPSQSQKYNPYAGQPQFSSSWEREMPSRSKAAHEDERRARRAASYEEPREEDLKEERRRRKEQDKERERERDRDRDRERERDREELYRRDKDREREKKRDKERERERERAKADRERADKEAAKADKKRLERDREKERDRARRREYEDKTRSKSKPAYVEHYSGASDEEYKIKKTSSSSTKKRADSPPPARDKSSRRDRDRSPRKDPVSREDKTHNLMSFAADYMDAARRKGSKSGGAMHSYAEAPPPPPPPPPPVSSYPVAYPDPNEWHASGQRRGSHEAKYAAVMPEPVVIDAPGPGYKTAAADMMSSSPAEGGRPPRLQKAYTSPIGTMQSPQAPPPPPPPRIPSLGRSHTMQPEYSPRSGGGSPQVPAPGAPPDKYSSGKHPSSDRRRRNSYDAYAEDEPPHRSSSGHHRGSGGSGAAAAAAAKGSPGYVRVYQVDASADTPRVVEPRYAAAAAVDPYGAPGGGGDAYAAPFPKVKVAPRYGSGPVYESKRFTEDDVMYSSRQYAYA